MGCEPDMQRKASYTTPARGLLAVIQQPQEHGGVCVPVNSSIVPVVAVVSRQIVDELTQCLTGGRLG